MSERIWSGTYRSKKTGKETRFVIVSNDDKRADFKECRRGHQLRRVAKKAGVHVAIRRESYFASLNGLTLTQAAEKAEKAGKTSIAVDIRSGLKASPKKTRKAKNPPNPNLKRTKMPTKLDE